MKPTTSQTLPGNSKGFSLIELMVSVVIGMIGVIVMMQVFSNAESQKRTTTGAGDAQSNGAMAIYALQRDIRQGGHGFNSLSALACPLEIPTVAHTLSQLAPVIINPPVADVPAGDANTDTLLVTYGSAEGSTEGDSFSVSGSSILEVANIASYKTDNRIITAPSAPTIGCALKLTKIVSTLGNAVTVTPSSGATSDGTLFNLGSTPKILAYAVRNGNLTVCDYTVKNCSTVGADRWIPIVNNIVSLRAEYGHDITPPPATYPYNTWNQTTPAQPSPPNQEAFACLWAKTKAIRIAVVARNSAFSKDAVTDTAPTWEGSTTTPPHPTPIPIDLSAKADWKNYRYKLIETVIPMRNLPWMALCP